MVVAGALTIAIVLSFKGGDRKARNAFNANFTEIRLVVALTESF